MTGRVAATPSAAAVNAFCCSTYCSTEDVVARDAQLLLAALRQRFGDFVIPVVAGARVGTPCRPGRISPRVPSLRSCRPTAAPARGTDMPGIRVQPKRPG
ncbi:hypothetical protein C731_0745 [Mycolicibacterium hassiacum DSM 44199]|uniref:Uncharacterized protein n=1 Tax=Mycolicibacterium hassiacum (strain DSM 44199 / CIP 105218 / JCM 12690 / 3849) TaxID=1122247 RepID=K5B9C7_MYCHD|nr:hypothetical protein C731_0745 [Mycolicibacterium hassiacum DSM 44199]MDA4087191.1 hypothetical protein [Mycolicibacterium hassiacum DSM 44199]PZN17550.1 MAG: hypothetical protein DIU75_18980 [Mycolicibacterium hassiacum]